MKQKASDAPATSSIRSVILARAGVCVGLAIPVVLAIVLASHSLSDLDIWLHDRAGETILAEHTLPRTNQYSFSAPDHPWVDHEWLFQVLVTSTGNLSGTDTALALQRADSWNLLRIGLTGLLMLILLIGNRAFRTPLYERLGWTRPVFLAFPAIVALAMIWPRLAIRPELISYCCFVLLIRWIEQSLRYNQRPGPSTAVPKKMRHPALRLIALHHPAGKAFWLTVFWAQCHGFYGLALPLWVLGWITLLIEPRLFGLSKHGSRNTDTSSEGSDSGNRLSPKYCLLAMLLAAIAGLFTPNLLAGWIYPLKALSHLGATGVDMQTTISELTPLRNTPNALHTTITVYMLSLVWGAIWIIASWGRVSVFRIAIFILAAWGAWQAQRNIAFHGLAFYLLHSGYRPEAPLFWSRFKGLTKFIPGAPLLRKLRLGSGIIMLAGSFTIATLWIQSIRSDRFYLQEGVARRFGGGVTPAQYPLAASERIASLSQDRPLRVVNNIDCAAFLIRQQAAAVFIDGRTEVYPARIWQQYDRLKTGGNGALEILHQRRAEAVCLAYRTQSSHTLIRTLFQSPDWRLGFADETAVLFFPNDGVAPGSELITAAERDVLGKAVNRLTGPLPGIENEGTRISSPDAIDETGLSVGQDRPQQVATADRFLNLASLLGLAGFDQPEERLLRRAHILCPDHPTVSHNLGNLLLDRSEFQAALPFFEQAARGNRRASGSLVNAGVCLFRLGRHTEAEKRFSEAVALASERAEAWVNLAEVRRLLGDRNGALKAYSQACSLLPSDRRLLQRAAAYRAGQ